MESFEKLKSFKMQHGHFEVGLAEVADDELVGWMGLQRSLKKSGRLAPDRCALLDGIGFEWESDAMERRWRESLEQLRLFHAKQGNADVPSRWAENPTLASWVSFQRARRKSGQLSDEQIKTLDELGFTWKSWDRGTWEDRLADIVAFKEKHGHCDIPTVYADNPKLGRFVNSMRTQRNRGALSQERVSKLEAVGFVWKSARGNGS